MAAKVWWALARVMAWCLMAPSHHLKQCCLTTSKDQQFLYPGHFTTNVSCSNHWNKLEIFLPKISFNSSSGQWVKLQPQVIALTHVSSTFLETPPRDALSPALSNTSTPQYKRELYRLLSSPSKFPGYINCSLPTTTTMRFIILLAVIAVAVAEPSYREYGFLM